MVIKSNFATILHFWGKTKRNVVKGQSSRTYLYPYVCASDSFQEAPAKRPHTPLYRDATHTITAITFVRWSFRFVS